MGLAASTGSGSNRGCDRPAPSPRQSLEFKAPWREMPEIHPRFDSLRKPEKIDAIRRGDGCRAAGPRSDSEAHQIEAGI